MENTKPRIGLAVMANEWFWKYKMFGDEFLEEINRDFKSIVSKLTEISEVINTEIVLNEEQAIKAARDLGSKNVDLTIVCPIIWASDTPLIRFLKEMDRDIPIFLWFYSPYKRLPSFLSISDFIRVTGTVGSLQFSHVLKRDKRNFTVIVGSKDEEPLIKEINEYAKAAKTIKDLKRTRVGLLPWRYPDIANTWCDEFKITTRLGPQVLRISVSELFKISQSIPEEEINSFANYLMKNYEVKVSKKSLYASVRASLALAKVFDMYDLDAVAIQDLDDELHQLFKTRPCLYVPSIFERSRVVSMEGDIHTAIAMLILRKITNQPVLFSEIYAFDKTENIMLMGHTTMLDINIAKDPSKIKIIPDCEYEKFDEVEGAYMYFVGKEGTVTMLSLINEVDNYRMIIGKGCSLPISDARIEGYSHIVVQPSLPVEDFLKEAAKAGAGQHWAVVYGDHVSVLEKFAELSGLNKTIIGG